MVLIVDDKPENVLSLRRTLELAGFTVDGAGSGEEALLKVLKNEYFLIILDVQMPGMDGFEVAEALRGSRRTADIPLIFLSAVSTEKRFITQGYKAGAVDYVVKPVDPDIFLLKVQTLHRLHEQQRELQRIRQTLLDEVAVRRRAEAALSARVDELRSILHSIPQIAFTLRPDGSLEFFNEHWARAIGARATMPTPHDDDADVLGAMQVAIRAGQGFQAELRIFLIHEQRYCWHLLRVMPVTSEEGISKWVGTFTDIHERKTASEYLEAAVAARTAELVVKNAELESSNHDLQQFASVASHDLKEPLRKIQLFGSVVQRQIGEDGSEEVRGGIARIRGIADRMSGLIEDLLNYSRLSAATLFRPTDLGAVAAEILEDFEPLMAEKEATVEIESLPTIDAIPGQMRQMLQNLVGNALKFSRPDVPSQVRISAQLSGEGEGARCILTIEDNGIGFDEVYLGKIFTLFQRLNTTEAYEGTGIGLAIVKKIVDRHGGTISARSTEGTGSAFVIELPVRQAAAADQADITEPTSSHETPADILR